MSVNREAKSGCINITQLLKFNSVKHTRKTEECTRLVKSQETPLPVHIALHEKLDLLTFAHEQI